MKKALHFLFLAVISLQVLAQAPLQFNYQAVLRDTGGSIMESANVAVSVNILKGSASGNEVFSETHNTTTNEFGLISLQIGSISSLNAVSWDADSYYLEIEVDGTVMGVTQLLSVPFAIHAATAHTADYNNLDNLPTLFDGDYNSLTGTPSIPSDIQDLSDTSGLLFDGDYESLINLPELFDGDYNSLDNLPELSTIAISGSYEDLSDKPQGIEVGEILFWDGEQWTVIVPGQSGETLNICDGIPMWGACIPVVSTAQIFDVTNTSATGGGEIIDDRGLMVTESGVILGTSEYPTLENNDVHIITSSGPGVFISNITNLLGSTMYYVRAYATNSAGTGYGENVSFVTENAELPEVVTLNIEQITHSTAVSGGIVVDNGGAVITERGVVWSISENPIIENNIGFTYDGAGTGSYVSEIRWLHYETTYYLRAYATNSQGTTYGNQIIFQTDVSPQTLIIGDSYSGGVVAYIFQPSDLGYVEGEIHGLIATPEDIGASTWGCNGLFIGETSTELGAGSFNTFAIINECSEFTFAAKNCYDLELNGFNDWYLPSLEELRILYINQDDIGGFTDQLYYSSSEISSTSVYRKSFANGSENPTPKNNTRLIRPIRTF